MSKDHRKVLSVLVNNTHCTQDKQAQTVTAIPILRGKLTNSFHGVLFTIHLIIHSANDERTVGLNGFGPVTLKVISRFLLQKLYNKVVY